MHRRILTSALALLAAGALASAGCGEDPQQQQPEVDAGVDAGVGDLVTYFGIIKDRCYEYTTQKTAQAQADLGVAVEALDENQFKDRAPGGVTHVIRYRQGSVKMTDYVAVDGVELKLYKREFSGGKSFIYNPAVTLLRAPFKPNDKIETKTQVTVRDETGKVLADKEDYTLRVDTFEPADENLPVGAMNIAMVNFDETFATNAAWKRQHTRSFQPGVDDPATPHGWGIIEFNFDRDEATAKAIYRLQKIRTLTQGGDPCGSSI